MSRVNVPARRLLRYIIMVKFTRGPNPYNNNIIFIAINLTITTVETNNRGISEQVLTVHGLGARLYYQGTEGRYRCRFHSTTRNWLHAALQENAGARFSGWRSSDWPRTGARKNYYKTAVCNNNNVIIIYARPQNRGRSW